MSTRSIAIATVILTSATPAHAQTRDSTLTIIDAVRRALEVHPSVRAAGATRRQAEASVGEFTADRLPSASLDGWAMRFQEPMLVAPIHALDATQLQFDHTLIQGALRVGYTLWDGGARGSSIGAARTQESVAIVKFDRAQMDVTMEVATSFLRVLSANEMLAALQDALAALGTERSRVERLLAEGAAARVELLRVEAAVAEAESERTAVEIELENARAELARGLDVTLDALPVGGLQPTALRSMASIRRDSVAERTLASNPDLAVAQQSVEAAAWRREAAAAAWYPRFDLVGGLLMYGSAAGQFTAEWQAGLQLSYPLYLGGRRSRTVDAATAGLEAAEHTVRTTELRVRQAVDRAIGATRELRSRVEALTRSVNALEEIARIERLTLEAGTGIQAEYLRAQADLRRARARLSQVRHTEIAAWLELARITGDLDVTWMETVLEIDP